MELLPELDIRLLEDIVNLRTFDNLVDELLFIQNNYIHDSENSIDVRLIEWRDGEFSISFGSVCYDTVHFANCVASEVSREHTRQDIEAVLREMFQEILISDCGV